MNTKRAVFLAVVVLAVAALTVPMMSMRAAASGSVMSKGNALTAKAAAKSSTPAQQQIEQQRDGSGEARVEGQGKISAETLKALGMMRVNNAQEASARIAERLLNKKKG